MGHRSILHIMQSSGLGGTEHAALDTMRALHKAGASFHVTSPRPYGKSWPEVIAIDPAAKAFPCRNAGFMGKFDPGAFRALQAHVTAAARQSDAIWISGSSVTSLVASRSAGRPRVMSHHYHHFGNWTTWMKWKGFYELLCRDLEAITFPTEFTRDEAARIAPWLKSRMHVVPLGYEPQYTDERNREELRREARALLNFPQDALIVGNGGWLVPQKRFDVFLETAVLIHARRPDSYFVICGGGPMEEELQQRAARLEIGSKIRFTGWVTNMQPYYQAWDMVLFNSDVDTLPRTPMEAASHGAIVVASLLYGGLAEFVTHGRNGYLLDRHDPAELSKLVVQVAEDPSLAAMLRQEALLELARHFSMDHGIAFYKDFFGL